ncbi:MAG: hypothetical protein GX843_07655 [Synergistaceae bacterium]|nr:hypothetical protein [Synergistaceae bacterium]
MDRSSLEWGELPLEAITLFIAGITSLIAGALLIPALAGAIPYYGNGLTGLILFYFALQTVLMGKTPFGDFPPSGMLLGAGAVMAAAGVIICIIPSVPAWFGGRLIFFCLAPGGIVMLVQAVLSPEKIRLWLSLKGVVKPLVIWVPAVYLTSVLTGAAFLASSGGEAGWWLVPALMLHGAMVLNLGRVLASVYKVYPASKPEAKGRPPIPFGQGMLLLIGVFMMLLGLLLLPVSLGILPFAPNAQLGLLLVIFAVQMAASGATPLGPFPRSAAMTFLGLATAAIGVTSCIVPGLLEGVIAFLVAVLNIAGGILTFIKSLGSLLGAKNAASGDAFPLLRRLYATQTALGGLSVMFGSSMLFPGVVPGLVVGAVLAANGGVLIYLMILLGRVEAMKSLVSAGEKI